MSDSIQSTGELIIYQSRYMDDSNFQKSIFPILAMEIYKSILEKQE